MVDEFRWPDSPYKGLSYYGPKDVPLFAGREESVRRCARQLADANTRLLVIHGVTGCGKTSFLRAGLVPFLESQRGRYEFARAPGNLQSEALFVRSTGSPLKALAAEIYKFASHAEIQTENGPEKWDSCSTLLGCSDAVTFVELAGNSGERMIQSLKALATDWPRTLVLIIDQGEEVLTLNADRNPQGEKGRDSFFDFLYRFNRTDFDLKLVIAIRTEYWGKFSARLGRSSRDLNRVELFFLNELTEGDLVQAIKRPTSSDEVPPYGRPFDQYHFRFEPDLPEQIARDVLFNQNIRGGVLPVVQIVCENLYNSARKKSDSHTSFMIKAEDYMSLPGLEVQMEDYLRQKLVQFAGQRFPHISMEDEVDRWKDVFSGLSMAQIDGTVVTQLKSEQDLRVLAKKCRLPFEETMKYLSDPDIRILRGEEVINSLTNQPIWAYSLGHDAIGLMMEDWKTLKHERQLHLKQMRRAYTVAAIGCWVLWLALCVWRGFSLTAWTVSPLIYAASFTLLVAFPRLQARFFGFLFKDWRHPEKARPPSESTVLASVAAVRADRSD